MPDLTYLHPMIVHFPIALLIIGFFSDVTGLLLKRQFFNWVGFYLLILGTLGLIAAFVTGNIAGDGLVEEGPLKRALEIHESSAELTLWIMAAAALFRLGMLLAKKSSGNWRWIAVGLYFIGVISLARTGHYGGQLVFNHAAGVQLVVSVEEEPSLQSESPASTTKE